MGESQSRKNLLIWGCMNGEHIQTLTYSTEMRGLAKYGANILMNTIQ